MVYRVKVNELDDQFKKEEDESQSIIRGLEREIQELEA